MSKIPVNGLIEQFQTMYQEHWAYKMGSAEKGCVDCSGAFVYSYRQYGMRIAHGSNTIGRNYIVSLLPISEAKPGMAAFKCKPWTESEEDKRNKWYGTEPGNLSHIGLVDQDVNYVLNAKGTAYGFSRDKLTTRNGWDYVAYLTDVEYTGGGGGGETKVECTISGGNPNAPIRMRAKPSTRGAIVAEIPQNSKGEKLSEDGDWSRVTCNGKTGYIMTVFVHTGSEPEPEPSGDTVTVPKDELVKMRDQINSWLG